MVTGRDPLDEFVGALARVHDADLASTTDLPPSRAMFEEILSMRELGTTRPVPLGRRRFGRPKLVAVVVTGLLLLTGAGYAATQVLTPKEQLSVFDRVSGEIPLPSDGNFDLQKRNIMAAPALQQEQGMAGDLAVAASCQWFGYWLDGYNRGDEAQMSRAAETIHEIPSWPQLTSVDPGRAASSRE